MLVSSRRRFLASAAALSAGLAASWPPRLVGAQSGRPLIARATLFGNPDVAWARLSHDGVHVAYIAPRDGVRNLWVAPIDDLAAARPVTRATVRPIAFFFEWAFTHRHIVYFEDRDGDENWRASSVDITTGAVVPLTPVRGVRARVQEVSDRFPREILFAHNARDPRFFDLFRVDVVTGRSQSFFENPDFAWLVTDRAFRLRLASRFLADGSYEWFERRPSGVWSLFLRVPIGDVDSTRLVGLSADGHTLYLFDTRERDKAALVAIDMATRRRRVLATDPDADLTRIFFDSATRRPLAAGAMVDRLRWHVVDPRFADDLRAMQGATRGDLHLGPLARDGQRALVYVEHDMASGEYGLYDRRTRGLRRLFKVRARLDGLPLRPLEPVVMPARDGLKIPGYLTLPETGARNVPLVLAIHGGPYARDEWGLDTTHQWLANRGYAVLSVNYRGSTGFGKAFVTAADREWGGKMQDDLIDAVAWAVGRGVADPRRVGFFGASYGGYAALTAATKTPEVFACIVDIFGVANLLTFMAAIPPYWRPWFSVWKQRLGDPDTEAGRAWLAERSPLTHIDRAFRPILIVQGLEDVRVTRAESEQMVAALRRREVPVTYITFPDEGHGFARPENHIAFRAVTEAFLAKHLGGLAEPIDRERDLAASSVVVEVGADLVPGLAGAQGK
jgi:dipeptidyl aminopeptidase/acylaminoacyl peptidase